jgi:hypothetical protein
MLKRYLHIGFAWGSGIGTADKIAPLIENPEAVDDWFKYGGNCWIVYTQYTQSEWSTFLRRHIDTDKDYVVVCEVTDLPSSNGNLPKNMWEWFNRQRF